MCFPIVMMNDDMRSHNPLLPFRVQNPDMGGGSEEDAELGESRAPNAFSRGHS